MDPSIETLTIKELEELCQLCFNAREQIDEIEKELALKVSELEGLKTRLADYLIQLDKTSYDSAFGKITVKNIFSVATPKTPEAKAQFFDYLKEKGIFEDLISVNSKTLNAFYKQELQIAQEAGAVDFKIPGLDEPFYKQSLSFKKG